MSTQGAMKNKDFLDALQVLAFDTSSPATGLLFTKIDYNNIPFNERLLLQKARSLKASAVYFRRFEGKYNSIPQIFIYDNSSNRLDENDLADIHKKIWSGGIVPLYYVFDKTQLKVFDSRKPVQYKRENIFVKPIDEISIVSNAHQKYMKYSAEFFRNGTFWEQNENSNHFLANKSANTKLIEGLRKIRESFNTDEKLKSITNKLLVLSILVKYLEERKDEQGNRVFPQGHLLEHYGAESFCEVIRKGKLIKLFNDLSRHFNGKIFELTKQEKQGIGELDLMMLADFLDATIDSNQQYVFWRLYAFDYLPVELISRIYEEFIPQRRDAVYTPIHLVNFMVDECMPIEEPKTDFKVIDVSCGSGIFLVSVFKRLVQWWQKQGYDKKGTIPTPDIDTLKLILKDSVYGVDIEPEAVQLSIFSLSIALCDMLDPVEIWEELQFEDLSKDDIIKDNFFNYLRTTPGGDFDLVIGNPPFDEYRTDEFNKLLSDYEVEITCKIPRNQAALLFLQQAMPLLKKGGLLSLVLPSGPLLYNDTTDYRKDFFSRYNIPQLIDFSAINLFDKANYPSVVLFAENNSPDEKDILHITVKRTKTAKEKLYFEIDHYDFHFVPEEIAIKDTVIWKTNLLGGGHLYHLIKRFQKLRTLGEYLDEKNKNKEWVYGEGYNVGNRTKKAPHLTDKRMVPTNKFDKNGIHKIIVEKETKFEGTREKNKQIFSRPHLLIKETPDLPVLFLDKNLRFKHEIIGIHAPAKEEKELKNIEKCIKKYNVLYKMLLISMSGRAGISRSVSSVLMDDIMNLPYPGNEKDLELSDAEKIVCADIINYGIEHLSKGENANVNTREASEKQLQRFSETFCQSLNSVYAEGKKQFYSYKPVATASYICCPFAYGNPDKPFLIPQKEIEEGNLTILMENNKGENSLYRRILKIYGNNIVYLIKPKILRYWLKSVALRDASETFIDLVKSGY